MFLKELHEFSGYPEEIFSKFDLESEQMQACLNYAVFDADNGILLKLGENKQVLAGLKGWENLSSEELQQLYGTPVPKYDPIDFPNLRN